MFILQTICNLHPIGRMVKTSLRVGYNQLLGKERDTEDNWEQHLLKDT